MLAAEQPGRVSSEFIYETAPFPSCHASTLAETPRGLVAAWFGGRREGAKDVGIWLSRQVDGRWSKPEQVATGQSGDDLWPCWNPVLFQVPKGPLLLFYKVGPSPSTWWGLLKTSTDSGRSWSKAARLKDPIVGPIKNKPVLLDDGTLLCGSSSEHDGWRVHMERTKDFGKTWTHTDALNDGRKLGAIQPTVLRHEGGKLQILCRSRGLGKIVESWSDDDGKTWSKLAETKLPNPNSGIDAVTLADGRGLLVYNHTTRGRSPLNVAVTKDGRNWMSALVLESEPGEYSYPAVIQSADGKVHVTFTWKRQRIKHVIIDVNQLTTGNEESQIAR